MSKRVRTSRIANSKKSRRPRPSGEREVAGRESLSSVDFDDSRASGVPSEAPESGPTASAAEPSDTDRPVADEASLTPSAVTAEVHAEAVVPALVTGETPAPAAVSAEEVVPGDLTPPPPAVADAAQVVQTVADAPLAGGKKKKKKNGAVVGGTRPEDVNASSGALSLNEPLARGFYESAPPPDTHAHEEDEVEPAHAVALSPEILERKARLRRIVMGVFAAASLVVLLVAGKTLVSKKVPQPDVTHAMESAPAPEPPKPAEEAKPVEAAKPTPAPAPAPEASAKPDEKKDEAKADEKKEEPKADEKKEEAPKPSGDPAELKKTANKLYNSGKLKDAIPALRDAIAADPDDAMSYLFLGDALTNTGKWPEAKEAYNECVRHAKKGPKYECAAMGGHK